MPAQRPLTVRLVLLVLLGTAGAGPFPPRFNVTLPAPRPPPQPGEEGRPSSQHYEHTVEGGEKQVVFTHRINLPPSSGCGCSPGAEPPAPASEMQALRVRLEVLEALVKGLKEQCGSGCCPPAAQAGTGDGAGLDINPSISLPHTHTHAGATRALGSKACPTAAPTVGAPHGPGSPRCASCLSPGQTDVRSLCSLHGVFDLSRCACSCEASGRCVHGRCVCFPGYTGPSCDRPSCPGDCQGRGRCVQGACVCRAGFTGPDCSQRACPRGCSQRGRCVDGRCACDPGYSGEDCGVRRALRDGRCECWPWYDGVCVCDPGFAGEDCGVRRCPGDCRGRGRCEDGVCMCHEGYTGEDCGVRRCPRDCSQRGVCRDGVCACWEGFAGEDCSTRACPSDCHRRGRCEDGVCVCDPGFAGPACAMRTCPGDCRGRGRCVQGTCVCHAGYSGEDCGLEEPPASACPGGCGPRELCRGGRCVCVEGFRGPDCAIQTCPGDCRGRGECRQGSCVCHDGFAGEDCGEEVPAVEGMRVQLLEETTVRTEWTRAPGPVDAYEIKFIPTVEGGSPPFTARVPSSASAYDQRGLAPGQEYEVTVRALRGTSWGPPTSKTVTTMIDGPQDLRVVTVTPTTLELSWLRPLAEVDRFVVSYVSAGNQRVRLEVPPEADRELLTDLMPGVEYVVTVTAERGRAVSYPASVRANTGMATRAKARSSCEGGGCCGGAAAALLFEPREFDSFVIQYKERDGPRVVPVDGPQRSALVTSLEPGRKYKFVLYGLVGKKRHGPLVAEAKILHWKEPSSGTPPRLGTLRVTDPTPDSLHLIWTVPEGQFDSFMVQYKDREGQPQVVPVEGPDRSVTVSPLDPDHKYRFSLFGVANKKQYGPLTAEGTTAPERREELPRPEAPEQPILGELTVAGVTPDSLRLSWTVARGPFDSFVVQYKDAQGQPQAVPVGADQSELTVPGLEPNRKYKMNLYGLRGRQRVGPASVVARTGESEPLGPCCSLAPLPSSEPRLGALTVTGATADSLSLSWTVPEGHFDHFLVQYRNGDGQPKAVRVPGHENEVTVSGLEPDHKYKMHLYGFHGGQRVGPVSAVGVTGEPEEETPSPPGRSMEAPQPPEEPLLGELTVTAASPDSLSLSWTVSQGHFDGFSIQYKDGAGRPQVLRVGGEAREATVRELDAGRRYKMNLYGLHQAGRVGPVSTVAETVTPPATKRPLEPRLGELTVTEVTPDSVSLSWTVPEGTFDSFVVQYKDKEGQPQEVPVTSDQLEVTIPNLEPATKYQIDLYGLHSQQHVGPLSVVAETDPLPLAPTSESPLEPRLGELTVTDVTPDSVGLAWTVSEGEFDSFMVQYKDRDGQPQLVPVTAGQREVTVPGLEPCRKYKFVLFGIQDGKRHSPVSVEARTAASLASLPRLGELWVTDATPDALSLSWTVPEGHFDSFVVQFKSKDGPQVVPVEGHARSVTVSSLDAGRKYRFLLYGLLGRKRLGPLTADGTTARRPPKPRLGEELHVTSVTTDSVDLAWMVPEGQFDSFVVQYRDRDGQPQAVPVDGSLRAIHVSGLDPARRYKLLLYGLHGGKRVGPLSALATTAPREDMEAQPETPSPGLAEPRLGELTVEEATPHSLRLSWEVTEGELDSFEIQYEDRDGRPQVVSIEGHQHSATLTGLESEHRYLVTLYGFHEGQPVGPVHVDVLTPSQEEENEPQEPPTTPEPAPEPRLGALTVTDASPNSLSLSWTVPEGQFDHFLVQYRNGDGQPKVLRVPGHEDEVTVSGLEPDHKYRMHLYGFHGGQRVGPVSAVGVTGEEETPAPSEPPTEAPKPPEEPLLGELTVTAASPDSLSLSWTVSRGHFDGFSIQYKDGAGRPQVLRVGGEAREATVRELDAGRRYKMNLYGLHQRVGPVSVVGVTAPLPTWPAVDPRLGELAVAAVTSDTVSLSWTVAQGPFDSFLVQYRDAQGQLQVVPVSGDLHEVTISALHPARKYKFQVFGLQDGKRHGPVSVDTRTFPDTKPSPRLGELTVTDVTPDSVGLAWTVPEGEFDSFVVQYKDRDGQPQMVPVASDQREVTVPSLEPNRRYKFLLYGLVGRKRLGPASADGTTAPLEEAPQRPRLGELAASQETSDSLQLSWTVAQGSFDSFLVQYRDADGQLQVVPVAAEQREVTVEGLAPGRTYRFLLYGLSGGQRLGPVSTLGATAPEEDTPAPPEQPEPPEAPRLGLLAVTEATPDSLRLSWSVVRGPFNSFVVQYEGSDGQPQALLVDGDQSKVLVSGLEPGTSYKFFLYGLHDGKRQGPVSAEGTTGPPPAGQTPGDPGPRLSQLSVTDVTTSSLRLNWEAPQGAFDSFLLRFGVPAPSTLEPRQRPPLQRELMVPGTRRSAVLRDLRPGTLYSLTLYGLRGPHKADSVQGTARTLSPVLESPRDLEFSDIRETSATVSWTPPPSRVDSFKVSYQLADGGEPQSVQVDGRAQTHSLQGLTPGARYEVTVVSVRGFEESEPLEGFLSTIPDGPTQLRAMNLTEGSALLQWTPPQTPVDKYNVRVTGAGAPPLQGSAPGSAEDYALHNLVPQTNYTATVRGLRGPNLTSPASITFTAGLQGPQDLEAREVTPRTALLTWVEPQVPPTGYLVSLDTPGEQTQEILLPAGVTSHRLLGLFPSTAYSAQLRAMWNASFSTPLSTSFTTGGLRVPFPRDCGEEMQNGAGASRATTVFLNGNRERPLSVFCDMETDGGGWLVSSAGRDGGPGLWETRWGGALGRDRLLGAGYWGNEALHSLTQAGDYSLRVDLRAGDEAAFAQYDSFRVDSAAQHYRLHLEGFHGTAGDGSVRVGLWPPAMLGLLAQGVSWYHWKGFDFSVPFTEMKLRPRSYRAPARGG
uniref:Tenascin XB n=1 Tax=Cavia porcellus TaxID=10141 RepID=H0W5V9_CAVPO